MHRPGKSGTFGPPLRASACDTFPERSDRNQQRKCSYWPLGHPAFLTDHDSGDDGDVQVIVFSNSYVHQENPFSIVIDGVLPFTEIARPFRAKIRRGFATVSDPPVRRYGGLRDQDRIFTNAYCRHDHGIKGAQVSYIDMVFYLTILNVYRRLAATGTGQKTSLTRVIRGSSKLSKTLAFVEEAVPDFQVD